VILQGYAPICLGFEDFYIHISLCNLHGWKFWDGIDIITKLKWRRSSVVDHISWLLG